MSNRLSVETRADGITVYRLDGQEGDVLAEWVDRVRQDVAHQGGTRPQRILHDLRRCEVFRPPVISHLRVVLAVGSDLNVRCAVITRNPLNAQILDRLIGVPGMEGDRTPAISLPEQVWGPQALVRFLDDYEAAVAWLNS